MGVCATQGVRSPFSTYCSRDGKNVSVLHHAGDQPAVTFVPATKSFPC